MIIFLEGTLVEKNPASLVMNVAGVGYEVRIPLSSYDRLPELQSTFRILIYDCIREDDHLLFGFVSEAERKMFTQLLTVSGIGPKLAITVLSGLSVADIRRAVAENDVKRLSSISGIGRKTAERIVVDLRDKISAAEALEATAGGRELSRDELRLRDGILALISLGYKRADAERMVRKVIDEQGLPDNVENLVRKALAG